MSIGEPQAPPRGRRCDRAAHRGVGGEVTADPVLAQWQKIGQVLDLSGALDLQRDPAIGRHRNPERRGRQQQRDRARQRDVIPLEPGDLPFDIEVSAVPTAVDREPQTLQP